MLSKQYSEEEFQKMHNLYRFLSLIPKSEISSVMSRGFGSYGVTIEFPNKETAEEFQELYSKLL